MCEFPWSPFPWAKAFLTITNAGRASRRRDVVEAMISHKVRQPLTEPPPGNRMLDSHIRKPGAARGRAAGCGLEALMIKSLGGLHKAS